MKNSEAQHSFVGEIIGINNAKNTLILSEPHSLKSNQRVFKLSQNVKIMRQGQNLALHDLKVGDRVTVQYKTEKEMLMASSISVSAAKPTTVPR